MSAEKLFDFIMTEVDPECTEKTHITISHFEYIAEAMNLTLDNLSLYVFFWQVVFAEQETYGGQPYLIEKLTFVKALDKWLPPGSAQWKNTASKKYSTIFSALRAKVDEADKEIRETNARLTSFVRFLYLWAVKGTESLLDASTELWESLFHDGSEPTKPFAHYVKFDKKKEWIDFVKSERFAQRKYVVSIDVFQCIVTFARSETDLAHYDVNESAYPNAIDDFVETLLQDA
ncbi:Cullin binding, putative [Angomonas deanei]|uniref:Cullin binding, putative n=1 Tax=Angomonas deanei TaxID=59799 RepID=A0A7G2C0I8_9TRYP|nr:Cullin binding, putative [Angomonas deanei]